MPAPMPLVIDTDPGIDDALAILLALASPEVDLRLVTTVHGNVELAQTTENALRVLHLAGPLRRPGGRRRPRVAGAPAARAGRARARRRRARRRGAAARPRPCSTRGRPWWRSPNSADQLARAGDGRRDRAR